MTPTEPRFSRRQLLQASAAAGAAAFLSAAKPLGTVGQEAGPGTPTGTLNFATWIGYMPFAEDGTWPILEAFTDETGIEVVYEESIDENEGFFASDLQGPLSAGLETGWDLIVMTDWMMQRLMSLGWLERIAIETMTNYPANLLEGYRARAWDPDNSHAAPYQSGMTGLGFDRAITGDLTSVEAYFDPTWAGRIAYQSELNDCVGLTAIHLGLDPTTLDQAGFDASVAEISRAIGEGLSRGALGNRYVDELLAGNIVLAQAWSGDVLGLLVPEQTEAQDFRFALPAEGGMLWTDNMGIPKGALGKADAEAWIDYYYRPEVAAEIEAFVNYVCPVKGAAEVLLATDPDTASNPLIFPTQEMRDRLHEFVSVDPATRQAWEEAFSTAVGL